MPVLLRDRPLRLAAVRHVRFGANPERPELSVQAEYFAERLTGYGAVTAPARPPRGNRNGYARMGERLLAELPGAPDLVVLAHALPDCDMSVSAGGYLAQALDGDPTIFAVSEQGRGTPFAALRLVRAHTPAGAEDGPRTMAVLVLDQGTLFYDDPALSGLDTATDHAVGLLFTPDGPVRVGPPVQHHAVAPERVADLVAEAVRELGPGPVTVTAGACLPRGLPGTVRRAPADRLCTSVWSDLAEQLAKPCPADRTILVAEYEPALGHLSLTACDVPAGHVC
ncbi:hypothetical protein [Actinomadura rubrisoli]|uniref:Uncharacterized protein n=1 Tax=Actinomadura rubrisoli TaxID=2530368 RepID=A0A4R5C6X2_9ACTN|nr:hypothetical protein [Actinomadura rubrisoli]TDD94825.1 hypothetical protein E1298_06130 [Actinomadura rubrisoli]